MTVLFSGSEAFGSDLRTQEFYSDEMETFVDLPDSACQILLDDEVNYAVLRIGERKIKISASGRNDRSASLVLDCGRQLVVYSLRYNSRRKYGRSSTMIGRGRFENAYIASTIYSQSPGELSSSIELADYSEPLLQVAARETWVRNRDLLLRTNGADVVHQGMDWRLSYGFARFAGLQDDRLNYRVGVGVYGLNVAHTKSLLIGSKLEDRFTWLYLPQPARLSLGIGRKSDGSEVKVADRFFSGRLGPLATTTLARYVLEKDSGDNVNEATQIRVEQSMANLSDSPVNSNTIECFDSKRCFLTSWSLRQPVRLVNSALLTEYAFLPHSAGASISTEFAGAQEVNFGVRHYFKQKSFVRRWRFVRAEEQISGTSETSNIHLEATFGRFSYFVDQTSSFLKKIPLATGFGLRFNGEKTHAGFRMTRGDATKASIGALFDIRYFFDKNIRSASVRLTNAKIRVRVLSVAGDKVIPGATVSLIRDGVTIDKAEASQDGDVLFTKAKCCGEFSVRAVLGEFVSDVSVFLSETMMEPSVTVFMEDHRKVYVEFFVKKEGNKLERLDIGNFYPEVGDAIVGFKGAIYQDNYIFIPISGFVEPVLNESILPYRFQVLSIDGGEFNTRQSGGHNIRVILEEKAR